jgi:hypothetical protein
VICETDLSRLIRTGLASEFVATYTGHSPVGELGRITVPIPLAGPGEVLVPVRGGTEAFAAWASQPIAKHSIVLILSELSGRSVLVTPYP